jgi:hypothetical protein
MERKEAPTWWRWLRGDPMEQLLNLTQSLTFLALPEAGVPDLLSECVDTAPAF